MCRLAHSSYECTPQPWAARSGVRLVAACARTRAVPHFLCLMCCCGATAVKLDRDDNKVFVTAEAPFSKRYLKVRADAPLQASSCSGSHAAGLLVRLCLHLHST